MTITEIMGDLIFAPYRIGRLQKNKKMFFFFFIIQIPYFLVPGIFFMIGAFVYLLFVQLSLLTVSFLDLLINSKKYKYSEEKGYSEEYLNIDCPILEL